MHRNLVNALMAMAVAGILGGPAMQITRAADGDTDAVATATPAAKPTRIAMVKLSGTLLERPKSFELSLAAIKSDGKPPAISDLMVTLGKAAKDDSIGGVFLDLSAFSLTMNQAQEIGQLLTQLRHSGKRVAVYSSDYSTDSYLMASYADTIIMPEQGDILIPGVGLQMIFFKSTLDKLNIQPDFVQIGKFKGAEEPFMRTTASPEYREQITRLVDGMYSELVSIIGTNRPNMTEPAIKGAIDEGWLTGKHAKELGMVDQAISRDKVPAWWESQFPTGVTMVKDYGEPAKKNIDFDSPFALFSLLGGSNKPHASSRDPQVAVIYALGEIAPDSVGSEDSTDVVTPAMIRSAVAVALKDDSVKAIVLRVDSPGGSASASDEIWGVLHEADKKKPVTVSMGRLAASGGYYISCAGRTIMADPATITGSIGVVAGKVVISGLLDKIGVGIEPVSRGTHMGMLSLLRPFSDEERTFLTKSMEETYSVFASRVMAARGTHIPKLEDVAQGRLFTGEQAIGAGLVDKVGTLQEAVAAAAKSVDIGDKYGVKVLPETKSFSDILRDGLLADTSAPPLMSGLLAPIAQAVAALPPGVQTEAKSALVMIRMLQKPQVLMALPTGLSESE